MSFVLLILGTYVSIAKIISMVILQRMTSMFSMEHFHIFVVMMFLVLTTTLDYISCKHISFSPPLTLLVTSTLKLSVRSSTRTIFKFSGYLLKNSSSGSVEFLVWFASRAKFEFEFKSLNPGTKQGETVWESQYALYIQQQWFLEKRQVPFSTKLTIAVKF